MNFINPGLFKEDDLPIIILCDDLRGFLGWAIKAHSSGNYSHVMTLYKPGMVATQNFNGFQVKGLDQYLKASQMLKFWRVKNMTDMETITIIGNIQRRLALPWWKRQYDFLGVLVGQLTNIRWLQNPWKMYCSEQIKVDYLDAIERLKHIEFGRPSPSDLDRIFKEYPDTFEALGYWLDGEA